jgi:predicted ATPase
MLRRLSVFAGWSLDMAEEVCSDNQLPAEQMLDLITGLVDKSLVVVDTPPSGAVRYRLLEPIRQYAHTKLMESGEALAMRQQHAHFFLALGEQAEPQLVGAEQVAWLNRLAPRTRVMRLWRGTPPMDRSMDRPMCRPMSRVAAPAASRA